jgi:BirA family biotin operon repressor/biotin-[acetyl-CoA-carboxylase] ligase
VSAGALRPLPPLRTRWLGQRHEHHESLPSTNDRALAWTDAPHGALVTADAQSHGRGRHGRSWHSPAGANLYASIVLRPTPQQARRPGLALAVGVGLHAGLSRTVAGLGLRWPNDVVVAQRKLAGILCEARWQGEAAHVVVGFGIDVLPQPWPPELAAIATTVAQHAERAVDRATVLVDVLEALEPCLDDFAAGGFAAVRERYEAACVSLGRPGWISDADGTRREVLPVGLDADGALLVRGDHEGLLRIDAGELLPAP